MQFEHEEKVYRTVADVSLPIHIFRPDDEEVRPAIVFFFGGGWKGGTPRQFFPHCEYFASRGMVAASAEYRVQSRHGVSPPDCVSDAKAAVRWLRAHAPELGVDPGRVAAGGGSAGGHLAACTGTVHGFDADCESSGVRCVPDALVLFNPVVDTTRWAERFGDDCDAACPIKHIGEHTPPTIIFHGTADTTVPFADVERFQFHMKACGRRCDLVPFAGQKHAFFNHGRDENRWYIETVRAADRFLASLGFLDGEPTI